MLKKSIHGFFNYDMGEWDSPMSHKLLNFLFSQFGNPSMDCRGTHPLGGSGCVFPQPVNGPCPDSTPGEDRQRRPYLALPPPRNPLPVGLNPKTSTPAAPAITPPMCANHAMPPPLPELKSWKRNQKPRKKTAGTMTMETKNTRKTSVKTCALG